MSPQCNAQHLRENNSFSPSAVQTGFLLYSPVKIQVAQTLREIVEM